MAKDCRVLPAKYSKQINALDSLPEPPFPTVESVGRRHRKQRASLAPHFLP